MKMNVVMSILFAGLALVALPALAEEAGGTSNMEILAQKVKADKRLVVADGMKLSDADGKKFWPLYDNYQKELSQLNQRLGAVIKAYADAHNTGRGMISNEKANELLNEALAVEEAEVKAKQAYAKELSKVLPATAVARAVQIETKIRSVLKFELAGQIPLVY